MAEDKIYTIPLRREWLKVPIYKRSRKAITAIKEFLKKHLKKEVLIGPALNEFIWEKGNRHPPGKVKIRIDELKERTFAELVNAPKILEKVSSKEDKKKKEKSSLEKNVDEKKKNKDKEKKVEEKETKEAIEKVPLDKMKEKEEKRKINIIDDKERSPKKEKIIPTEKAGQIRKD